MFLNFSLKGERTDEDKKFFLREDKVEETLMSEDKAMPLEAEYKLTAKGGESQKAGENKS